LSQPPRTAAWLGHGGVVVVVVYRIVYSVFIHLVSHYNHYCPLLVVYFFLFSPDRVSWRPSATVKGTGFQKRFPEKVPKIRFSGKVPRLRKNKFPRRFEEQFPKQGDREQEMPFLS
jgi:hypothetical protein